MYNTTKGRRSAVAIDGLTPVLINPTTRTGGNFGLAGNNPDLGAGGVLLVLIQASTDAAPNAAAMQAGKWTWAVDLNGTWQDGGRDTVAYGCMLDAGATGAVDCWELI